MVGPQFVSNQGYNLEIQVIKNHQWKSNKTFDSTWYSVLKQTNVNKTFWLDWDIVGLKYLYMKNISSKKI